MSSHPARLRMRAAAVSAVMVLAPAPLLASPSAQSPQDPGLMAGRDLLKPLPASRDQLTFRGENGSAAYPVFLSRTEAARASIFQIGLLNTVSLLPERSTIRIAVNGRTLATSQIRSAEKVSTLPVRIPPGVLVPGFNAVQVSVAMSHRVDCSVPATYELWSMLDRTRTGFLLPSQAAPGARTLDDLAAESPADDGTTRIHLRAGTDADPQTLSRAAEFIAALTARSNLIRPVVDVGPDAGTGAGFDIALTPGGVGGDEGQAVGRQGGVVFTRNPAGRLILSPADGETDIEALAADLRAGSGRTPAGTLDGVRALDNMEGAPVNEERRLTFAELGVRTESTAGRRYVNAIGLTLPSDFYPGSYDKAEIHLDGSRVGGLDAGSSLVFRVNGTLVSTLPLGPGSPDRFDRTLVDLPLQFFRPGYNEIKLEALMPTASDQQCDPTTASSGPRLTIEGTSDLTIPHFARLATAPQIVPALNFGAADHPSATFYAVRGDATSVGIAMTVAANMAATTRRAGRVEINLDEPSPADKPGIVIGALGDLPSALAGSAKALVHLSDGEDAGSRDPGADRPSADASPPVDPAASAAPRELARLHATLAVGEQWLRHKGFFFGAWEEQAALSGGNHGLVVAAATMDGRTRSLAGFDLPRVERTPRNWLIVSGLSTAAIAEGVTSLVAENHWKDLNGEAVLYDPTSLSLKSRQARDLTYVMPERIALTDIRPVLGGVMSGNILVSVAGLLVLLGLLGVSTQLLLRLFGER